MKIVRKTLLASAITAALAPATAMADTTLFGNFDIAVGIENGAESALAITDSPSGDNVIGVEGNLDLENGNAITYQYVVNVDLDGDTGGNNGFGANYHSYVGYKWDAVEVRAGNQDLPLRLVLDQADQFAGTYADFSGVIGTQAGNTTATSSVMVLGGNDMIDYAISADLAGSPAPSATAQGCGTAAAPNVAENANCDEANDAIRWGGMIDVAINENIGVAAGFEVASDRGQAFGLSADIGLTETANLALAFNQATNETAANDGAQLTEFYIGGNVALSDTATLKLGYGLTSGKSSDATGNVSTPEDASLFAIGADFAMSENMTTYVLFAQGEDQTVNGVNVVGGNALVGGAVEADAQGENNVFAAGVKLSF